ncbi:MAG TPA: alpha/beta hydrolase [Microbacterium sp.]|nr:alpha/beta hydrolase [Microbacterium sp.]
MDIILVPGLWLDASSWDDVVPALERAGHTVHALTMPGVGAPASGSSEIGIADWVDAVVDEIDATAGLVVLVGHSGGGNVVYGAADARPERIARIVFVDTFPPGDGGSIWEFPIVDGVIPFPGWDFFEEPEIADLDEETRARAAAGTRSVPARVPTDPLRLGDERRRLVPMSMLTGTVPEADIREYISAAPDWVAELAAVKDLEIVELHSGHWPQFSKPGELASAILAAVDR